MRSDNHQIIFPWSIPGVRWVSLKPTTFILSIMRAGSNWTVHHQMNIFLLDFEIVFISLYMCLHWNSSSSQVELYRHSATCVDIQWNKIACLTGPRDYRHTTMQENSINLYITYLLTYFDYTYAINKNGYLYINKKIQTVQLYKCFANTVHVQREHRESSSWLGKSVW